MVWGEKSLGKSFEDEENGKMAKNRLSIWRGEG